MHKVFNVNHLLVAECDELDQARQVLAGLPEPGYIEYTEPAIELYREIKKGPKWLFNLCYRGVLK